MGCIEAQWIGGGGLTQCGSCAVRAKRAVDQGVLEPSMQLDMRILGSSWQAKMRGSGIGGAGLVASRGICIRLFGPLASGRPGYEPLAF